MSNGVKKMIERRRVTPAMDKMFFEAVRAYHNEQDAIARAERYARLYGQGVALVQPDSSGEVAADEANTVRAAEGA